MKCSSVIRQIIVVAVLATPAMAPAASVFSRPPPPFLKVTSLDDLKTLARDLGLRADQVTTIDGIVTDAKARLASLRTERGQLEGALEAELAKSTPDETKVSTLVDRAGANEAAQQKTKLLGWLRIGRVLSPDQRRLLDAWSATRPTP